MGLSQEGLAHAAGLDRSYVGRIERGEHNLTFVTLVRLARAMRCDGGAYEGRARTYRLTAARYFF